MDLLTELEIMATNVVDGSDAEPELESSDVLTRWQQLFCYTHTEAIHCIKQHRSNFSRERVSDEHWEMVRCDKEAEGYDREAYEHALELGRRKKSRVSAEKLAGTSVGQVSKSTYILKLEGPLDTAAKVQEAAGLETFPAITTGTGDLGEARFATIDSKAKGAIVVWLSRQRIDFAPTLVKVSKSGKELSEYSIYPTLGVDSTLPQYRADTVDAQFMPAQNQYPVWYFFYGTLAVPDILTRCLALPEEPIFTPAAVIGGVVKRWLGTYNALVDGPDTTCVDGWAYLVVMEEHEEALRCYETENYEIVRCSIVMKDTSDVVKGLTFRFVGASEHLE